MTDGLYFYPRNSQWQIETQDPGSSAATPEPQIDLTTFAQWIELQPTISTHAGLLELIGNDLYRRSWPTSAGECKRAASDLRILAKYKKESHDPTP